MIADRATLAASHIARRVRDAIDRIPRWVHVGFALAENVSKALPTRQSTPIQAALQVVSAAHAARTTIWPESGDPVARYAERNGLEGAYSEHFVRLFFASEARKSFAIGRAQVSDYQTLITAKSDEIGELAFLQYKGTAEPEPAFYVGRRVNMDEVVRGIWDTYEGRLHVSIVLGDYGRRQTQYLSFPQAHPRFFGGAGARLETLIARHRRFVAAGLPRAYCFHGPPGTGKSAMAVAMADALGERTIRIDATSLANASVRDVAYLLDNLRPHFAIIDDVDAANVANAVPTLLEVLQRFKADGAKTTAILTANATTGFNPGLLRPGRIDTWVEFALPNESERGAVLGAFARELGVDVSPLDLVTLARATADLSQDYLREVVLQVRDGGVDDGLALVGTMRRLLAATAPATGPVAPIGSQLATPKADR